VCEGQGRKRQDYILISLELEASGKPAAWLTERLDKLLDELLPSDGATARI